MRKEITCKYIADDGEEFDTEEECVEYEETVFAHRNWIVLDCDGNKTDVIDKAWYIEIKDDEKKSAISRLESYYGFFNPPTHAGKWFYDYDDDTWKCLEDEQMKLNDILKIFQGAV